MTDQDHDEAREIHDWVTNGTVTGSVVDDQLRAAIFASYAEDVKRKEKHPPRGTAMEERESHLDSIFNEIRLHPGRMPEAAANRRDGGLSQE